MKRASVILCAILPIAAVAAEPINHGFWGVGKLGESWNRMNTCEKCIATILIPPGYVLGICYKGVAWLFMGQRNF